MLAALYRWLLCSGASIAWFLNREVKNPDDLINDLKNRRKGHYLISNYLTHYISDHTYMLNMWPLIVLNAVVVAA